MHHIFIWFKLAISVGPPLMFLYLISSLVQYQRKERKGWGGYTSQFLGVHGF